MASLAESQLDEVADPQARTVTALLKRLPEAVKEAGGHAQLWGVNLLEESQDNEALRLVVAKFARARPDVEEAYKMLAESLT